MLCLTEGVRGSQRGNSSKKGRPPSAPCLSWSQHQRAPFQSGFMLALCKCVVSSSNWEELKAPCGPAPSDAVTSHVTLLMRENHLACLLGEGGRWLPIVGILQSADRQGHSLCSKDALKPEFQSGETTSLQASESKGPHTRVALGFGLSRWCGSQRYKATVLGRHCNLPPGAQCWPAGRSQGTDRTICLRKLPGCCKQLPGWQGGGIPEGHSTHTDLWSN